jgi:ferrous iron transport protein B
MENITANDVIAKAEALRNNLSTGFRDEIVKSIYSEAEKVANRAVRTTNDKKYDLDQKIDRLVTSPWTGLPIMLILLAIIIWLTVSGANVASDAIATVLFALGDLGRNLFDQIGMPWWITGFIWDGVYQRHAAADDDLLPRLHLSRRPRLFAARRLQHGLAL